MPCMCWYDPGDDERNKIKELCQKLVKAVQDLEKIGDPIGISITQVKQLIDHLYDPLECKEKPVCLKE